MKYFLLFIGLILMLASCKESESKSKVESYTNTLIEHPTEISDEIEVELTNNEYEMFPYEGIIELSEKVFDIKTDISLKNCETFVDGCDCCTGKIVFIDENIFIEEFYCIPNNNFYVGYYSIYDNKILLYYETKFVSYGPEDSNEFKGYDVYKVHQFKNNESVTLHLSAYNCNEKLIIKSDESFYAESETITAVELLEQYSSGEFWDLLTITEIIEDYHQ